jgi:hypothetical protein
MRGVYPYHVRLGAWGYVIELRSDSQQVIDQLLSRLPANFEQAEGRPDVEFLMCTRPTREKPAGTYRNGQFISEIYNPVGEDLWDEAERAVNLEIASYCPDHVFVHAGVVALHDACIVLPGRTRSGKSELTRAMVELGATYLSDEYAVIDQAGLVHPYARALSQRKNYRRVRTPAPQLGWLNGQGPLPIAALVVTQFEAGHNWEPQTISRGQAVWSMFHNTVSATISPALAMQILPKSLQPCSHCYQGPRGEATDTASRILKQVFEGGWRSAPKSRR